MSFFKRSFLGLALAGVFMAPASAAQVCYFGECGAVASTPTSAAAPSDSGIKVLVSYGSWQVLADSEGHRMIADSFDHSKLVIGKENGAFQFFLVDSAWNLPNNKTFDAKVVIDGRSFVGTASVLTSHMLSIKDVSPAVMKAMYHGENATILIGGMDWTLSLENAGLAIDAAAGLETVVQ